MLSSLFPRSSIYKSLDDDGHGHAFDTGNTALFSADELDEENENNHETDHATQASSITRQQRGHRYQPSLPDPFEHMPHTGTISTHLPLITSAPASPGSDDDRRRMPAGQGKTGNDAPQLDPFEERSVYTDDPMAALSKRLNSPYGVGASDRDASEPVQSLQVGQGADEGEPPTSIMFGDLTGGADTVHDEGSATADHNGPGFTRKDGISARSHLASSSHILGTSRQVPWWLRQNRKRLIEDAEASTSRSTRLQRVPSNTSQSNSVRRLYQHTPPSESPATHTMFLPTHGSPSAQHSASSPPSANVRMFVQKVYNAGKDALSVGNASRAGPIHLQTHLSKKDKALWNWANVDDLDEFLQEVYTFYVKKGIWSIALAGFLDLLTIGFVITFSVFLLGCVDYSVIRQSHRLADVVVPRCVSRFHGATLLLFLALAFFYALRIIKFGHIIKRLFVMRDFFTELLEIPESDMQTVPWPVIVEKISKLRSDHPAVAQHEDYTDLDPAANTVPKPPSANKPRLDAHDVANRIMRKENYFIALFNKNVLNTAIPIPPLLARSRTFAFLSDKLGLVTTVIKVGDPRGMASPRGVENASAALLTRVLEWNLTFCLMGFLFGPDGQVRRQFVSERNRKDLVAALQRRFVLMGCINAIFAPFIILYLLFYSFFRYFEEYHKNPSSLGTRSYTQLARWKFREFNELPHIFQMRLHRSYPLAEAYVSQFPNDRMAQLARFVAFVSGSFASVLVLFSLLDPDAFLHFEITPDRTVLFYIGIFGSLMAIARGMVPDDHRVVDPEASMREVIEETHYMPVHWRGNLHSADVHREFSLLFPLKIVSFFHEILSVLTTPLVLWFTLPRCSAQIIDFFREFTIHVDGLGYVCSFAVFDFAKTGLGDVRYGAPAAVTSADAGLARDSAGGTKEDSMLGSGQQSQSGTEAADTIDVESQDGRPRILIDERLVADQGKLEKSILGFKAANPTWQPQDQSTSLYLSRMTELASGSVYLPHPSGSSRRDFSHQRPGYQGNYRSGSRSTVRRSRQKAHHGMQPSPFTSPILEDEDALHGARSGGLAMGASSMLDRGMRHGSQIHQRLAHARGGTMHSQMQQHYSHTARNSASSTLPIAEKEHADEVEDLDPYIRPDEGFSMHARPTSGARPQRSMSAQAAVGETSGIARGKRAEEDEGGPPSDITGLVMKGTDEQG